MIISIIIRTKNEEKWIGLCLQSVLAQKVKAEIEIIIVDNVSTDNTLEIANRYKINRILLIEKFLPGKALNIGIKASKGDYIVCLSAHCIPKEKNWLEEMLKNCKKNNIAGVYGRQLPTSFTKEVDKRDLITVFGLDRRKQEKDYFFHNANSMIPRSIWKDFPFDENVTNIEDRVWGKKVIEAGYNIIYEPEACVYHYHGLNQSNIAKRAIGVVSILNHIEYDSMNSLPYLMLPENVNIAAVLPIYGKENLHEEQLISFSQTVSKLKKSKYIKHIYCLSYDKDLALTNNVSWLDRNQIEEAESKSLNEILLYSLKLIEKNMIYLDSLLYVNYSYKNYPDDLYDKMILEAQYKGCDTVFPGIIDFGHYWFKNKTKEFEQTDPSLQPRAKREPLYKAIYGLGCLTAAFILRKGEMVGGKIGIHPVKDTEYTERLKF